ncbi:MAG TPA: hypothetical protein VNR86_11255 [Sphingomicrobium sp.]|nr:hypothetical protein [Sphingomicrobium sp.]
MSKKIPLELRQISKQRSIRSPGLPPDPGGEPGHQIEHPKTAEWPIRSSLWL